MTIELKIPDVGESIVEVYIGPWLKKEGEPVREGEPLVEIETDKATMEIPAPVTGTLTSIVKREGDAAEVGDVIGMLAEGSAPATPEESTQEGGAEAEAELAPQPGAASAPAAAGGHVMPAAQRLLAEHGVAKEEVQATGPGGRVLKEDVQRHLQEGASAPTVPQPPAAQPVQRAEGEERIVRMSPIRRRIAERLVEAQQTAALLTTFNEVDMSEVIALRKQYRDAFQEKHGVKLGFMSFFVKAAVDALQMIPEVNAEIRGTDIVYRDYCDIGIAVGGGRGLVVPVLRRAEQMSFADIELAISDFARRAADNTLRVDELQGGTFTISNGGVYGSLLSTPIVNPPQSGILGLHRIEERPVARDGAVVIRPMMYLALTYDHRIVDGREAVTFLRRIKETIEQPARLLIEV